MEQTLWHPCSDYSTALMDPQHLVPFLLHVQVKSKIKHVWFLRHKHSPMSHFKLQLISTVSSTYLEGEGEHTFLLFFFFFLSPHSLIPLLLLSTNASNILMAFRPQTRSPQYTINQIEDNSLPCGIVPVLPQYIDGHSTPSTHTVDSSSSPYTTPSILLNPHVRLAELSSIPISNNPHAYSLSLASNPQVFSPTSTYIPLPSSPPSQKYFYSPPEECQYYPQNNDTSQQN